MTYDASNAEAFNAYIVAVFTQSIHDMPIDQPVSGSISNNVIFTPDIVYKALQKAKRTLSAGPDAAPSVFW